MLRHGRHDGQVVPDRSTASRELTNTFEVARIYRFKKGSGFPVSVPSVDLVEIGAGGGSLARVDDLGLLKVGPESRRGRSRPGVLRPRRRPSRRSPTPTSCSACSTPAYFLGGDMPLDLGRQRRPRWRRSPTGSVCRSSDTAAGIHELVNQNMAAAARMHAVEQGERPARRDRAGVRRRRAGPRLRRRRAARVDRVVFPVNASVLSAFGTLVSPVRIDLARSKVRPLAAIDPAERDALLDELRAEGRGCSRAAGVRGRRRSASATGSTPATSGQGNEITVWVGEGDSGRPTTTTCVAAFEADYRRIYGLTIPDVGIEAVTWRLSAVRRGEHRRAARRRRRHRHGAAPIATRPVAFGRGRRRRRHAGVPPRRRSASARSIDGPAIVEERETTAVIRPGWTVDRRPRRHHSIADEGGRRR